MKVHACPKKRTQNEAKFFNAAPRNAERDKVSEFRRDGPRRGGPQSPTGNRTKSDQIQLKNEDDDEDEDDSPQSDQIKPD